MKIATRLILLSQVAAVLPLALFSYFNLREEEATLRETAFDKLSGLADKKATQIKSYLAEREREVNFRSRGPQVMAGIDILGNMPQVVVTPHIYGKKPSYTVISTVMWMRLGCSTTCS